MEHILVIDDEETVIDLLDTLLTNLGYDVKIANSGTEGIALFNNGYDYNLVLTDINMPGMDGNEVAKHVRSSSRPETPIVAITGLKGNQIDRELFDFILLKPFKLEDVVDVVRSFT